MSNQDQKAKPVPESQKEENKKSPSLHDYFKEDFPNYLAANKKLESEFFQTLLNKKMVKIMSWNLGCTVILKAYQNFFHFIFHLQHFLTQNLFAELLSFISMKYAKCFLKGLLLQPHAMTIE